MACATELGQRARVLRAIASPEAYSRLRVKVPTPSAADSSRSTESSPARQVRGGSGAASGEAADAERAHRSLNSDRAAAIKAISPTSGTYIRRSAPTSVAMGTMLDVGA